LVILHRLKGAEFILNAELIETIEANPDTVITLTNDKKFIVKETVSDVLDLVLEFKTRIHSLPIVKTRIEEGK
jgi:flagellar protein FlbD